MSTLTIPGESAVKPLYTKRDFVSDQTIRWCPGCGDYAILDAVQKVFASLGIPRENFVMVSGIGCSCCLTTASTASPKGSIRQRRKRARRRRPRPTDQ